MSFGSNGDMELIYGNILSAVVLRNVNIIKKKDVIHPHVSIRIRNDKIGYIDDSLAISKLENPEFINETSRWSRNIL